jgi:hypothetical protein
MPMIPAGRVETAITDRPKDIAGNAILATNPNAAYCMMPDGSIDNRAETNKVALEVAQILQMEMDAKDPVFCAGIVLMFGNPLNFRFGQISEFTGIPRRFCQRAINNLGYSRLVFKRKLAGPLASELDKPESEQDAFDVTVLFALYCLVGAGQIRTAPDLKTGEYLWMATAPKDLPFYEIKEVA